MHKKGKRIRKNCLSFRHTGRVTHLHIGWEVGWNLSGLVVLRLEAGQAFSVHPLQISSDAGKHIPEPISHLLFALWVALQLICAICECCM